MQSLLLNEGVPPLLFPSEKSQKCHSLNNILFVATQLLSWWPVSNNFKVKSTDCSLLLTQTTSLTHLNFLFWKKWNVTPNSEYYRVFFYSEMFPSNEILNYKCQRTLKSSCVLTSKVKMGLLIFTADSLATFMYSLLLKLPIFWICIILLCLIFKELERKTTLNIKNHTRHILIIFYDLEDIYYSVLSY